MKPSVSLRTLKGSMALAIVGVSICRKAFNSLSVSAFCTSFFSLVSGWSRSLNRLHESYAER